MPGETEARPEYGVDPADIAAWASGVAGNEGLPDFWAEMNVTERLAGHLTALGYARAVAPLSGSVLATEGAASGRRVGLAEDLEFDPSYRRQRRLAAYLIGAAVNALRGARTVWSPKTDPKHVAKLIRDIALANGIVAFDEWHHAPMCPANNWSRMALPEGPCTCGAAARKIR